MNLYESCFEVATRSPTRVALEVRGASGEEKLSYSGLFAKTESLAAELARRGLRSGDRLAFYLGNRVETAVGFLACLRLGVVVVPINLAYQRREIAHILQDAEPRFVLSERARCEGLESLSKLETAGVEEILYVEDLTDCEDALDTEALPRVGKEDLALLLYTSGTTGRSKGAMLTHGNLLATIADLQVAWAWRSSDCLLLTLPLFHTHGLVVGLATALASGARVQLRSRFEAQATWRDLASGGPSLFFGVPTMYVRLLEACGEESITSQLAGMRLFCSGSAPLGVDTHRAFRELTGHSILERYGMTETGMNLSNPYRGDRVPGTVGKPLPGVSTRIVDSEGRDVEPGATGGLQVSGDNVFSGYWRAPEKTAESFVELEGRRFFRTGDLAKADPETGFITLLGREGDLIISGGLNIYPKEVEEVLLAIPGIREAAVVARSDPEWGESPVAFLVASEPWDPIFLEHHCRDQMARFKVPREFLRLERLPRNALGKVEKHRLRALAEPGAVIEDRGTD